MIFTHNRMTYFSLSEVDLYFSLMLVREASAC